MLPLTAIVLVFSALQASAWSLTGGHSGVPFCGSRCISDVARFPLRTAIMQMDPAPVEIKSDETYDPPVSAHASPKDLTSMARPQDGLSWRCEGGRGGMYSQLISLSSSPESQSRSLATPWHHVSHIALHVSLGAQVRIDAEDSIDDGAGDHGPDLRKLRDGRL